MGIAVLSFGSPAVFNACIGATMLESQFPMKEYVQIQSQVYCPLGAGFYRWSWQQNLRDILGSSWWLRLLLPTAGSPVDLQVGIGPRLSPAGAIALQERVVQVQQEPVQREVRSCEELGINPGPHTENHDV